MTGGTTGMSFDGDAFAPIDRFDAYHALYAGGVDVERLDGALTLAMSGWRLDRSLIYDRRLAGVGHRRDSARVRRDGFDHFTLTLALAGEFHADAGGGFRRLRPGEILLLDMTRPMHNRIPGAHVVTMSLARARVRRLVRDPRRLHGVVIPAARALLLRDHMISLTRHGGLLSPATLMPVGRVGIDLLAAAVAGDQRREGLAADPVAERVDRVRAFIAEHLFDPGFGPDAVIARFALSRATLYRDFQRWGGLASYVRIRRIEALRERLADPHERRPLADLAEMLGFSTEARLSEAFLAQVGMRPGVYRRTVQAEGDTARMRRQMREWQDVLL